MRTHHSEEIKTIIAASGSRSPMMVKAQVSPGLAAKTKPQIEQRSSWVHPENSRPSPQCGQRLRSPRRSAGPINFEREGVMHKLGVRFEQPLLSVLVRSTSSLEFTASYGGQPPPGT